MKIRKNLKKTAIIMVLVLAAMPGFAQQGQGRGGQGRPQMTEEEVKERVAAVADTLELNEKQEKVVLAAELEYYKKLQVERENFDPDTGDRDAMRAKMRTMREEVDKVYKETLNEKQYKKYTEMLEERRSRSRQGRGGGQGEGGRGRGGN